jgi:hypothetical protein
VKYSELIQVYFERSTALQWYWTVYIIVIGGVLGFSTFRLRPDIVTTVLITILYVCFAYKNLGAIEATLTERNAILSAITKNAFSDAESLPVRPVPEILNPALEPQAYEGVRNFHVACDLMTIAVLWVKEWRRRKTEFPPVTGAN